MSFRACVLIPVYNHHRALAGLVAELDAQKLPVVLVDDGSDEPTRSTLDALVAANPASVQLVRLAHNEGKGAAVLAGLAAAAERGYTHAVQIDADGQHDAREASTLLALAREQPGAMISGTPDYDESVPALRYYGRWLTHVLVWVETLSGEIVDSMCGFRVYPVAATLALARKRRLGQRMDFDTEVMVRLYLAGVPLRFHPVSVRYPDDGVSHFRLFRDNLRMIGLHLRLLAGLPLRLLARARR
ncbi:MAG: glycosyltransferase family 2 protein [Gammaproteobacteria bacterium]